MVGTLGGGGQVEHAGRLGVDRGLRLEDGDDVGHRRGLGPGVELGVELCHGGVAGDGEQGFLPSHVLGALTGIAVHEVVAGVRDDCIPEPLAEHVALPELLARDASLVDYVRDGDGAGVVEQVAGFRASRCLRRVAVAVADEVVARPDLALLESVGGPVSGCVVRAKVWNDAAASAAGPEAVLVGLRRPRELLLKQALGVNGAALHQPRRKVLAARQLRDVTHLVNGALTDELSGVAGLEDVVQARARFQPVAAGAGPAAGALIEAAFGVFGLGDHAIRSAVTFERRLLAVLGLDIGVGGIGSAAFQDVRGGRGGSAGEADEDLMSLVELVLVVLRDSRGCDDCWQGRGLIHPGELRRWVAASGCDAALRIGVYMGSRRDEREEDERSGSTGHGARKKCRLFC